MPHVCLKLVCAVPDLYVRHCGLMPLNLLLFGLLSKGLEVYSILYVRKQRLHNTCHLSEPLFPRITGLQMPRHAHPMHEVCIPRLEVLHQCNQFSMFLVL